MKRKNIIFAIVVCITMITLTVIVTSCNVTRTVTTTSQVVQKGDTTTTITSKTIESYDASKR